MPVPGETLLIFAAVLAHRGEMSLPALLIFAWAGSVLGDNIGYLIGKTICRATITRYGGKIGLTNARISAVEETFSRYGSVTALENVVAEIEGSPGDRLQALLRRGFSARLNLESAVRAWGFADQKVRTAVDTVDAERACYLKNLLVEAGVDPDIAESRAWLIIWAYLGRSLSPRRMKDEEVQAIVDDLSRLMRLRGGK